MSKNNSANLLKAKIAYKKELIDAENATSKESIKPVKNKAISSNKLTQGRTLFQRLVEEIKRALETDYAHEFANKKAIASFMKIDTRNQKATEESLNA